MNWWPDPGRRHPEIPDAIAGTRPEKGRTDRMTRTELRIAVRENTNSGKITADERLALGNFLWKAIDENMSGDIARARAVIDFLHQVEKISLEEAFNLADLL